MGGYGGISNIEGGGQLPNTSLFDFFGLIGIVCGFPSREFWFRSLHWHFDFDFCADEKMHPSTTFLLKQQQRRYHYHTPASSLIQAAIVNMFQSGIPYHETGTFKSHRT